MGSGRGALGGYLALFSPLLLIVRTTALNSFLMAVANIEDLAGRGSLIGRHPPNPTPAVLNATMVEWLTFIAVSQSPKIACQPDG